MSDDPLEEPLRSMATDYHQAPAPDRDAMWAAIQARRAAEAPKAEAPVVPLHRPRALPRWAVPVGMAALLALAFGLGRLSRDGEAGTKAVATNDNPATPSRAKRDALVHQAAAVEYLGTVEVFLTDLPQAVKEKGRKEEVSDQARRLLATTRLLLDTPAGDDRRMRPLLEDLELVLAEIAQLPAEPSGQLDLITQGLDQRGTLTQLRSKVSAGPMPALNQGEL